jgi:hypothetical protein
VPPTVLCPSCGAPLPRLPHACQACGLSLTGPAAVELWNVDQQLSALRQRRGVLLTQLRNAPGSAVGLRPAPPRAAAGPGPHGRRGWPAQQVLLSVGALLIVIAASVFLAVAWDVLGVGGQVAVMAVVTVIAGGSSVMLARRGLHASAEAVAVLAVALALVDAAAARWLNLLGLDSVNGWAYAAGVSVGLTLVLVAVSPPVLKQTAVTYRLVAVLAATAAPLLGLVAAQAWGVVAVVVLAVVAALAGVGSRRLPKGWFGYRRPLTYVFGGYLVLTWVLAPLVGEDAPGLGEGGVSYAVALVVAVGAGWAADLHRGLRRAAATHPVLAVAALLGGTLQLVTVAAQSGLVWLALLAVAGAAVPAVLAGRAGDLPGTRPGVVAVAAQLVSLGALLVLAVMPLTTTGTFGWTALAGALAGACCSAVVAARRPRWNRWASGWAATTGAGAVAAVAAPHGPAIAAYAVAAAAGALVAVTVARPRLELVLGRVAVVAGLVAVGLAALAEPGATGLPPLSPVLAGLGLVALAYGTRPQRGVVSWLGVLLCSAGNTAYLSASDVTVVEAYSLPLATLALVVGLVRLRRQPASPSWLTVGPAVSTGLLPSSFATVGDASLTRPLVVLVVAAAVMIIGVRLRWQAPFVSGALATCVVAVAQLAPYAVGVPRWVSFGAVGATLLVLGFRYEQRRRDATSAVHWVAALR